MKLIPEILTQPHVPKPLHGVAPREIMGQQWWDIQRQGVYASTLYHCAACGVHKSQAKGKQHLEAHEAWEIDYNNGIATIKDIVPLCHYCHNFIHTGRLAAILDKEKTTQEIRDILEHGFKILADNKLKCFPFTLLFAQEIGAKTFKVKPYKTPLYDVPWGEWKLVWRGEEYRSKFASQQEWSNFYAKK